MADAAPVPAPAPVPPKAPSPLRWILLGCGALAGILILGMGGCAGIFYFIYSGTHDTAEVGASYLRKAPEMKEALGTEVFNVKRNVLGWNVQVVNDGGNATFAYTILGAGGASKGEATVWLLRSGGKWAVAGARVRPLGGDPFSLGKPPRLHPGDNWD